MAHNDLIGFGLLLGYFVAMGLPMILLKAFDKVPFEVARKLYHLVIALSIFPMLKLFSSWYAAVLAALALVLLVYPLLAALENTSVFERIAVEREGGEFKRSLIIIQLAIILLIVFSWGLLGADWKYIAAVAIMAWGFGDAAAALVGKAIGRKRIRHPRIEGAKTVEGTLAMLVVAGLAIFFTLLLYAGQTWQVSAAVALLVAPVGAAVELFSRRGMDTLTVPLSVGASVLALMLALSLAGI